MTVPDDALCRECRYPLKGLTTPRCPECGTEFDPTNESTFHGSTRREEPWQGSASLVCLVISLMVLGITSHFFSFSTLRTTSGQISWRYWAEVAILIIAVTPLVLSMLIAVSGVRTTTGWHRVVCLLLLLLEIAIFAGGLLSVVENFR